MTDAVQAGGETKPSYKYRGSARDWREDFEHENGQYMNICCMCGALFCGHKCRAQCKVCANPTATLGATPPIPQPDGEREIFERRLATEEKDHERTIMQRDAAEEALGRAFSATVGSPPEWSNRFGYADAVAAIEETVADLRARATAPAGHVLTEQEIVDLIEANTGVSTENGRLCVVNANIAARAIVSRLTSLEPTP